MSVTITGKYLGNLKVELTHEPTGSKIITDAPKDNNGEGSTFSPTDLVAGALGSCIMTILGIVGQRDGIDLSGMRMEAEKNMSTNPRRIGPLPVTIHLPHSLPQEKREKLERAGNTCPVHSSLLAECGARICYVYDI